MKAYFLAKKIAMHIFQSKGKRNYTRLAFASRPCRTYSHVNSNPLAPTHRGANLCRTESAKAHPAYRKK